MYRNWRRWILAFVLLIPMEGRSASGPSGRRVGKAQLQIDAGDRDRVDTLVPVQLPPSLRRELWLESRASGRIPVQVDTNGWAVFRLPELRQGTRLVLRFGLAASGETAGRIRATRTSNRVEIATGGHPLGGYQLAPDPLPRPDIPAVYRRSGYLHPLVTPSGRVITDDYPTNHVHHHGVWSAWTRTRFDGREPDFWNMGAGKGWVEHAGLDTFWAGPVHAGWRSRLRHVDLTSGSPVTALDETWEVRAYGPVFRTPVAAHVWDFTSHQRAASATPLELLEYHYGGLGFRGLEAWNGAAHWQVLTSEGETNRVRANTSRVRWCWVGGASDGGTAGVAFLVHPDNFRFPQPIRVHPDEPFLCFAPPQGGPFEIRPETPLTARYRMVVFDGPPSAEVIEHWWQDYAHPPTVVVTVD